MKFGAELEIDRRAFIRVALDYEVINLDYRTHNDNDTDDNGDFRCSHNQDFSLYSASHLSSCGRRFIGSFDSWRREPFMCDFIEI